METNINFELQAPKYSSAQNPIPVMINIDYDSEYISNYMLNTYVVYDEKYIDEINPVNEFSTRLTFTDEVQDLYREGDSIFLYLGNGVSEIGNEIANGTYTILQVVNNYTIIIDYAFQYDFITPAVNALVFKYFKYKHKTDRQNNIRLDFQPTLKDFVGKGLLPDGDDNMITLGEDYIKYGIIYGEEYNYTFNFDDNYYDGGNLGFVNSTYTSVLDVPYKIGDKINVTQIVQEWNYDDNTFDSGHLGFISDDVHNFQVGDMVYVTGQVTNEYYNGYSIVVEVPNNTTILVDKTFGESTGTEPGKIYGNPVPQYNGNATIIDIKYVVGVGVVITVDKPHNESTMPIKGKMNLINNAKFGTICKYQTFLVGKNDFSFNYSFHNRFDNRYLNSIHSNGKNHIELLDEYLVDGDTELLYKASTILSDRTNNLATEYTNNWITYRFKDDTYMDNYRMVYSFYDTYGNLLGKSYKSEYIDGLSVSYATGLKFMLDENYLTDIAPFSFDDNYININSYEMTLNLITGSSVYVPVTKPLSFKLEKQCVGIPHRYSLIWLDSNGSYISYPFNYLPEVTTEVTKSDYYIQNLNTRSDGSLVTNNIRGGNDYYNKSSDKIKLASGWLNDSTNIIFEDLIRSNDIYLQVSDIKTEHTYTVPVTLDDKSIRYKSNYHGDMIFNYTPTVSMAVNDYRYNNYVEAIKKYNIHFS